MTSEMSEDTTNKWENCDSLLLFLVVVTRLTFRTISFSLSIRKIKTRVRSKKENGRSPLTKTSMY